MIQMWIKTVYKNDFICRLIVTGCYGNHNPNCAFISQSLFDFCHSCLGEFCILRKFKALWGEEISS